jgi:hypothetical protein
VNQNSGAVTVTIAAVAATPGARPSARQNPATTTTASAPARTLQNTRPRRGAPVAVPAGASVFSTAVDTLASPMYTG